MCGLEGIQLGTGITAHGQIKVGIGRHDAIFLNDRKIPDLEDRVRWIEEEVGINPRRRQFKEYIEESFTKEELGYDSYILGDRTQEAILYYRGEVEGVRMQSLLHYFREISVLPTGRDGENRVTVRVRGIRSGQEEN